MRDKAQWSEAARDDPERLSIDEFLAFRHPESSHASILQNVEETLNRLGNKSCINNFNVFLEFEIRFNFNTMKSSFLY